MYKRQPVVREGLEKIHKALPDYKYIPIQDVREAMSVSYTHLDVYKRQVYYRVNSLMNQVKMPAATAERVKGMVSIRDTVRELIAMQMEEIAVSYTHLDVYKRQPLI